MELCSFAFPLASILWVCGRLLPSVASGRRRVGLDGEGCCTAAELSTGGFRAWVILKVILRLSDKKTAVTY